MSELQELWEEIQANPLRSGEQSIVDAYQEDGETAPTIPGFDPAEVSSDLFYEWRVAAEAVKERAAQEAELQAERQHQYELGRAQAQGMRDVHDPTAEHQTFVRDLPPADRRKVQRNMQLRNQIQDATAKADLKRIQAERSGSGYVADKLMDEVNRLEFTARLDHEELEALTEEGLETLETGQDSAALQSAKEVLGVFERPNVPLSHLDEKISEANRSPTSFGYARRGNDKLLKVSVEGMPIRTVFERLRNDERTEDTPDHELLLTAAERGLGGYKYHVEEVKPEDLTREPASEPGIEAESGDGSIEITTAKDGAPEVSYHEPEEEKREPEGVKPRANIFSRI